MNAAAGAGLEESPLPPCFSLSLEFLGIFWGDMGVEEGVATERICRPVALLSVSVRALA